MDVRDTHCEKIAKKFDPKRKVGNLFTDPQGVEMLEARKYEN